MKKPPKNPRELALEHFMGTVSSAIAEGLAHPNLDHGDAVKSLVMSLIVTDGVNSTSDHGYEWLDEWRKVFEAAVDETVRCRKLIGHDGSPMDLARDGVKVQRVHVRRAS